MRILALTVSLLAIVNMQLSLSCNVNFGFIRFSPSTINVFSTVTFALVSVVSVVNIVVVLVVSKVAFSI